MATNRLNMAQAQLMGLEDQQFALATEKLNEQNDLATAKIRISQALTKLYEEGKNSDDSEVQTLQQQLTTETEQSNLKINNIAYQENAIECQKKGLETVITKWTKELEQIEKAEETETPATVENDAEKTIEALFEKIDSLIADIAEIKTALNDNAIDKAEEEEKEEESTSDKTEEEEEEKIEKQDEEAESIEEINKADDEEEKNDEEETKIEKRTQKVADIPKTPETVETFFNRTNRDSMGRKIRN